VLLRRCLEVAWRYLLLGIATVILIFPFVWMLSSAVKSPEELFARPPILIPARIHWENFPRSLEGPVPFGVMFVNSTVVSLLNIVGSIISCSLAAYGFARLRFPGRDTLFALLLASMMVPFVVRLVPLFLIFERLGWINTLYPLIVPAFLGTPFFIFVMRQFFRTVPGELADAARIDGCSEMGIWARLMLPLSKPALGAVAILSFQQAWSDYLAPVVFLNDTRKMTVMVGLGTMLTMPGEGWLWETIMAVTVLVTLPMVVIFFAFQRAFVQGMTLSGMKG
jgi:multiple sugar transport system permease protein